MSDATAASAKPVWLFTPTLHAIKFLVIEKGILHNVANSLIVSFASTFCSVVIGMFCAYALARYDFPGKEDVSFWVLTNRMLPPVAVILPMFIIFQAAHLLDTRLGLVILYTGMQLPFVVWMLTGYFRDILGYIVEPTHPGGRVDLRAFRIYVPENTGTKQMFFRIRAAGSGQIYESSKRLVRIVSPSEPLSAWIAGLIPAILGIWLYALRLMNIRRQTSHA